jgi:hypothetical protein
MDQRFQSQKSYDFLLTSEDIDVIIDENKFIRFHQAAIWASLS